MSDAHCYYWTASLDPTATILQIPPSTIAFRYHFAWQPSAGVSAALGSSYLSHVTAATTKADDTGTCTTLIAERHWSLRIRLPALSRLVTSA